MLQSDSSLAFGVVYSVVTDGLTAAHAAAVQRHAAVPSECAGGGGGGGEWGVGSRLVVP